ncbi:hypothetical protein OsJ_21551 [Oryza sativa Japonica Group]|uniref:Uncharacterized protein n=1 Tax=Oryza sativa subsp. japonica TaxID=39947 RepID=A3BCC3_ORYSJ|nr:hypothetical protein OsJ_21551 [Oryza sativa Japonica Group]
MPYEPQRNCRLLAVVEEEERPHASPTPIVTESNRNPSGASFFSPLDDSLAWRQRRRRLEGLLLRIPYRRTLETPHGLGHAFEASCIAGVREEPWLKEQNFSNFHDRDKMRLEVLSAALQCEKPRAKEIKTDTTFITPHIISKPKRNQRAGEIEIHTKSDVMPYEPQRNCRLLAVVEEEERPHASPTPIVTESNRNPSGASFFSPLDDSLAWRQRRRRLEGLLLRIPYRRTLETPHGLGHAFEASCIAGVREEPWLKEQNFSNFHDRDKMRLEVLSAALQCVRACMA